MRELKVARKCWKHCLPRKKKKKSKRIRNHSTKRLERVSLASAFSYIGFALLRCNLAQFRFKKSILTSHSSTMICICYTHQPAYAAVLWDASSAHHKECCCVFASAFSDFNQDSHALSARSDGSTVEENEWKFIHRFIFWKCLATYFQTILRTCAACVDDLNSGLELSAPNTAGADNCCCYLLQECLMSYGL